LARTLFSKVGWHPWARFVDIPTFLHTMALQFVLAHLIIGSALGDQTAPCSGVACEVDAMKVELLQSKVEIKRHREETGLEANPEMAVNPRRKSINLTTEQGAMVPKNLKPVDQTDEATLLALNVTTVTDYTPSYYGWYCGYQKRIDVAEVLGVSGLTVEQCYIFSCVQPFKVSSSCGYYFYTNGGGNCKCCQNDAQYFKSSQGNNLYACR